MVIEVEALLPVGRVQAGGHGQGCGFPQGLSTTTPVASGVGPALGTRVHGGGRGPGGTCWVLSLPCALYRIILVGKDLVDPPVQP